MSYAFSLLCYITLRCGLGALDIGSLDLVLSCMLYVCQEPVGGDSYLYDVVTSPMLYNLVWCDHAPYSALTILDVRCYYYGICRMTT